MILHSALKIVLDISFVFHLQDQKGETYVICHDAAEPIAPLTIHAQNYRQAAKYYGLCLDHYDRLQGMTGQANIVKVFCGGKDSRKSKLTPVDESNYSQFKLWKMEDKIYTECFRTASRVSKLTVLLKLKMHNCMPRPACME